MLPPSFREASASASDDDDSWSDQSSEDGSEEGRTPQQPARDFPELAKLVQAALDGAAAAGLFPRLTWSAPTDAAWMSADGTLRCRTPGARALGVRWLPAPRWLRGSDSATAVSRRPGAAAAEELGQSCGRPGAAARARRGGRAALPRAAQVPDPQRRPRVPLLRRGRARGGHIAAAVRTWPQPQLSPVVVRPADFVRCMQVRAAIPVPGRRRRSAGGDRGDCVDVRPARATAAASAHRGAPGRFAS